MDKGSVQDLIQFRLEQAHECLEASGALLKQNHFKDSANRSYYAIFHSMRAVLALDGFDSKKHSGVISEFRKRFIKTGKFEMLYSKIIGESFDIRIDSDYEDFYTIAKDDVRRQHENADMFHKAVCKFIEEMYTDK